jgi:hypothetical protein
VRHPKIIAAVLVVLCTAAVAAASVPGEPWPSCGAEAEHASPWAVTFAPAGEVDAAGRLAVANGSPVLPGRLSYDLGDEQATRRVVPVEYSDGYKTRAKIHKIASIATLPLFVANYFVGQNLYDHPGEENSQKGLHGFLGASTGVLFGLNSVTGIWNLYEGRKDPNHRARRMTHGILMLVASAGFVATAAMTPDSEGSYQSYVDGRSRHRTVALSSMGVATASYLMMLFWRD